ncbi:MAG: HAMP domain-containing histidine kinase [Acidobacteria bacterium]|nr:HAMP domain-containing histidine kinase [Acidobacteriota bacterium]
MAERAWLRSFYWRIAAGVIVLLAAVLAAQVGLFLWLAVRTEGGLPPRMLHDVARLVATDLTAAIEADPSIDLARYARRRIESLHRPAVVLLLDGRIIAPPDVRVPPRLLSFGRRQLDRAEPAGEEPVGAYELRRPTAFAPVVVHGKVVAGVLVPPVRGPRRVVGEFGPLLAGGLVALLVCGAAVGALLIFRPAQARLRALEDAARRLGEGDPSARAPVKGSDEIADVAHAFNRMADELVARQADLTAADRARRQLLADVSHELRTPLTAIRGYAETLTLPPFSPVAAEGLRAVGVIREEVERIDRLVDDLLDVARYEAGGVQLTLEPMLVAELFARVEARHAPEARERGVRLSSRIAPGAERLTADARRLEQALQNLAANALRHTPAGGEVTLTAERVAGRLSVSVRDTGAGIPAEHVPHVFDRFYKADPARAESGTGLGLSIVRAIVERHGGHVTVRSTPGVETVFEIALTG